MNPDSTAREVSPSGPRHGDVAKYKARPAMLSSHADLGALHNLATARWARHHKRRVEATPVLRRLVGEPLMQRWSPRQVSRLLRRQYPDQPGMQLCHESTYQAVYQAVYQPGSALLRPV